jgi:hypothetical protein
VVPAGERPALAYLNGEGGAAGRVRGDGIEYLFIVGEGAVGVGLK